MNQFFGAFLTSERSILLSVPYNIDISKLLDLLVFRRFLFLSMLPERPSSRVIGPGGGVISHWLISIADEVNEDKIEIKSVFVHTIPVVSGLHAFADVEHVDEDEDDGACCCSGGCGSSDARRLLELGMGAKVVPMKSEYLRPLEELDAYL